MGVLRTTSGGRASAARRWGAKAAALALAATAASAGLVLVSPGIVGADSPNPTTGSGPAEVVTHPTLGIPVIKVTLSGTWDWVRGNDCNVDRWAAGWEIDWNDANQPGHVVDTLNGVTYDVGVANAPGGQNLNAFDNTVDYYNTVPRCGVRQADRNVGNWGPMVHYYPANTQVIAPCAVLYDIHEDKNAAKVDDLVAGGNKHNSDNSIEKNSADVNICFPITVNFPPKLTLVKMVDNSKGGAAVPADFTLTATGPTPITGKSGSATVTNAQVTAGTYTLSETPIANYTPDAAWSCTGGTFTAPNKITVANASPAQNVTCTIWNRNNGGVDLELQKNDDGLVKSAGGLPWDYTITVRNLGTKNLSNAATVTDNLPTPLQYVAASIPSNCSAVGQKLTCAVPAAALNGGATVTIVVKVVAPVGTPAGTYLNQAYVDTLEDPVCPGGVACPPPCPPNNNNIDCEPTTVDQPTTPAIRMIKKVNGTDANAAPGLIVAAGTTLSFTYEVSNVGNSVLNNVTVTDDKGLAVTCPSTVLAIGASMICTAVGPAPAAGQYTNVGTATGTPPTGPPLTSSDPANAFVAVPAIDITKFVNGADANTAPGLDVVTGAAITWTYRVENTGNIDLVNVKVTDDKGVAVDCGGSNTIALLKPGEVKSCSASGTAVSGLYTNIGTVVGTPSPPLLPGQPPVATNNVTDADTANYTGTPQAAVLPPAPDVPPGRLPDTGSSTAPLMTLAITLLAAGAALVWWSSRRRPAR